MPISRKPTATAEPAPGIAAWHRELTLPGESMAVFRDGTFQDEVAKTNLAVILDHHGLGKVRRL